MRKLRINNWSFWLLGVLLAWLVPTSVRAGGIFLEHLQKNEVELFFKFEIVADGNVYLAREGQVGQEWFGQGSFTKNADNGGNCELYGNIKTIKITVLSNVYFYRAVTAVKLKDCEKLESFELSNGKSSFSQIEISGCPLLENLAFNDCGNGATLKATNSPKLKEWNNIFTSLELDNTGAAKVEGDNLQTVKLANCSQLTRVRGVSALNSLTATNCAALNTIEANALQTLALDNCGMSTLTAMTSLTSLRLRTVPASLGSRLGTVPNCPQSKSRVVRV